MTPNPFAPFVGPFEAFYGLHFRGIRDGDGYRFLEFSSDLSFPSDVVEAVAAALNEKWERWKKDNQ